MTTKDEFDPYLSWLGIRSEGKVPDHYTLLGISRWESSEAEIKAAADRKMKAVHQHQAGPRGDSTQDVLNRISAAKICLLDPVARKKYDESLENASIRDIVRREEKKLLLPIDMAEARIATARGDLYSRSWFPMAAAFLIVVIGATVWGIGRSIILDSGDRQQASEIAQRYDEQTSLKKNVSSMDRAATITQSLDHILVLPPHSAKLASDNISFGIASRTSAISGWTTSSSAAWRVAIDDCRDGYFRAEIRYRTDGDCVFELLESDKVLATISLPSSGVQIRLEEKFVRLTQNGDYVLTLKPKQINLAKHVEIFRVRLVPRK